MALKSILAVLIAFGGLVLIASHWRRRPSLPGALLLGAASCFLVVTVVHLFEAFSLVPSAGWGQPHSIGHYIDLAAAVLTAGLTLASIGIVVVRRTRI